MAILPNPRGYPSHLEALRRLEASVPAPTFESPLPAAPVPSPPQPPLVPETPPQVAASSSPWAQLLPALFGLGARIGGSPTVGTGAMLGYREGQEDLEAQRVAAAQQAQLESARQLQEEQRRQQAVNTSLDNLRQTKFKREADYDAALTAHDQLLGAYGVRPGTMRRLMGPFIAPSAAEKIREALDPLIREHGVTKLASMRTPDGAPWAIKVDLNDDGIPEILPIPKALTLGGISIMEDPVTGQPMEAPPDVKNVNELQTYYADALGEAQAKGQNPSDPKVQAQAMEAARRRQERISASYRASADTTNLPQDLPIDPASSDILSQTGLSINAFMVLTGRMSQLSRDRVTRERASQEAQQWARERGVDISTLASQYKTYNDVLSANISRLNNTKIMESELEGTIDNLSSVVTDAGLRRLRLANVVKVWAGQEVNDPLAQQYALHLGQLRNELSAYYAATQGRTGNNITMTDQRDAELVIRNGLSTGSLAGLKAAIQNSTAKMDTVMQGSVQRARKAVWDLFGVGQNYPSVATTPSTGSHQVGDMVMYQGKRARVTAIHPDGSLEIEIVR